MGSFQRLTKTFGRLVALRLAELQLTPRQLAQQVPSVNRFTVRRIIAGEPVQDPHLSTMAAIADALRTDLPHLLGSQDAPEHVAMLSPRSIAILTLAAQLPPVWQAALEAGLRELVQGLTPDQPAPPSQGSGAM